MQLQQEQQRWNIPPAIAADDLLPTLHKALEFLTRNMVPDAIPRVFAIEELLFALKKEQPNSKFARGDVETLRKALKKASRPGGFRVDEEGRLAIADKLYSSTVQRSKEMKRALVGATTVPDATNPSTAEVEPKVVHEQGEAFLVKRKVKNGETTALQEGEAPKKQNVLNYTCVVHIMTQLMWLV